MANMSFAITQEQYLNQTKDVTRRNGWKHIKIGKVYNGVNKCMGFKKGEHPVIYGQHIPISSRWEPLRRMIDEPEYGRQEVIREGFPDWSPEQFVEMYCKHNKCKPETLVNRIEFKYVNRGLLK
jgi:hypothetical protein